MINKIDTQIGFSNLLKTRYGIIHSRYGCAMKKMCLISFLLIISTSLFAQYRAPAVINIHASQRTGLRPADITYNVTAADCQDTVEVGDMVLVPAGEFEMGDNFGECRDEELPVHTVYLDAFYIGIYEVTNAEYAEFLNAKGNQIEGGVKWYEIVTGYTRIYESGGQFVVEPGYENHPVVVISWYGAVAYCNWFSEKEGLETCYDSNYHVDVTKKGYRLPTEAEWEKAARGDASKNTLLGHQRRYAWGDEIDGNYANYWASGDPYETGSMPWTTPVGFYDGSLQGNFQTSDGRSPYGAYDMTGNVWEWCSDWYDEYYYSSSPCANPLGADSGREHVIRGGCWELGPQYLLSALRINYANIRGILYIGFRIARSAAVTGIHDMLQRPEKFMLYQNYPNPFNPVTKIRFQMPEGAYVKLIVYDVTGREVARLVDGNRPAGYHEIDWDASVFASGVYIYKMTAGAFSEVKRMVLIK